MDLSSDSIYGNSFGIEVRHPEDRVYLTIGSDSYVDCKILKGVTVGEGAVVGAGSVVVKDVRPWTIVGGNPAREIKEIEH